MFDTLEGAQAEMTVHVAGHDRHDLSQDQIFVRAVRIATNAHRGQTGKDHRPYIEHCERVAMRVEPALRPIAYLHDVVEKSEGWTLDRLRLDGFPDATLGAIDALTRREDEDEEAFVLRAAADPLALPVKRADLEDNLQQALIHGGDVDRYRQGLAVLAKAGKVAS
jgi:(p)ppGpp synthase/HD superfamily hydrolase